MQRMTELETIKNINAIHRQACHDRFSKLHNAIRYRWEQENENENRCNKTIFYILMTQYMHLSGLTTLSTINDKWPIAELVTVVLGAAGYLPGQDRKLKPISNLMGIYTIKYINSRYYSVIPYTIRALSKTLNMRDPYIRFMFRNVRKMSNVISQNNSNHKIRISDILATFRYFAETHGLTTTELMGDQPYTRLYKFVYKSVEVPEYNLETQDIGLDDMSIDGEEDRDELEDDNSPTEYYPEPTLTTEVVIEAPLVNGSMSSEDMITLDDQDGEFTVIKKGKRGNRAN